MHMRGKLGHLYLSYPTDYECIMQVTQCLLRNGSHALIAPLSFLFCSPLLSSTTRGYEISPAFYAQNTSDNNTFHNPICHSTATKKISISRKNNGIQGQTRVLNISRHSTYDLIHEWCKAQLQLRRGERIVGTRLLPFNTKTMQILKVTVQTTKENVLLIYLPRCR